MPVDRAHHAQTDLETIRILAVVSRQGSFAAAARRLDIDPSSVSRTVSLAERALGFRLFHRTTRALAVTEEGDVFLRRMTALLEDFEVARDQARRMSKMPSGTLRLTASVAFAHRCIVPQLANFRAAFPEIAVELLPSDANLDVIAEGLDLAIRLAAAPEGDLVCTQLATTRYRIVASPAYLAKAPRLDHPNDLTSHNCLRFALPRFRDTLRFQAPEGAPFEVAVRGSLIIASALSLREAALEALGPVLLADWLIGEDLAAGRLVDVFPDHACAATELETAAYALYPSRAYLPARTRVMIDFLRDTMRGNAV